VLNASAFGELSPVTANVETSSTVPPSFVAGPAKWTPDDAYRSVSGPSVSANSVGAVKSSKLIVRVAAVAPAGARARSAVVRRAAGRRRRMCRT
jgi:hypothetical protein